MRRNREKPYGAHVTAAFYDQGKTRLKLAVLLWFLARGSKHAVIAHMEDKKYK
jgi:hypothetical protein